MADALNDPRVGRACCRRCCMLKNHEAGIAAIDERLEHEQDMVAHDAARAGRSPRACCAPGVDVQEAITLLARPAAVRPPHRQRAKLDDDFADRTVDRFLTAYRSA